MAEISTAGIPEPDGDFGIWGVKNNVKVMQLIAGHNDHDGKIAAAAGGLSAEQNARAAADAALQAEIDAIPDGPPGPPGGSDEAFAEWVEDPASLTNAAVTAQTRDVTVRQAPVALGSAPTGARREYPVVTKPLTAPVLTYAQQGSSGLYWPWVVDRWQQNPTIPASERYALFWSTDHGVGGIYWLTFGDAYDSSTYVYRGLVFNDLTSGTSQTETPALIWNEVESLWFMYYQVIISAGQVTKLATSPNLTDWTVAGVVMQKSAVNPAISHTGYMRPVRLAGRWYAFTQFGQGRYAMWSSSDGRVWRRDARDLSTGQKFCTHLAGFTYESQWRIRRNSGAIIMWNGSPWLVGAAGPYAPGGLLSQPRSIAVPLSAELRDITSRPVDITPPPQTWEGTDGQGIGNVIRLDDGRMIGFYRGGGPQGAFGLMEVA